MSTGRDCEFFIVDGKHYYALETHIEENYDTYGPFSSFDEAEKHLVDNHANPGGFSSGGNYTKEQAETFDLKGDIKNATK